MIERLKAREILDSRGLPTVEVELETPSGVVFSSVPSGKSTGSYEAVELRDGGRTFHGKGVLKAVHNVNTIGSHIVGMKSTAQEAVDKMMIHLDGTDNKKKFGANSILAISMALARAGALENSMELWEYIANLHGNKKPILPVPFFNVINGGEHAGNDLDIQEYMLIPKAKSFSEAVQIGSEVYQELKLILEKRFGKIATSVGDEGGFVPPISCPELPFDLILDAADNLGYVKKVSLGIDAAANSFYDDGTYNLEGRGYSSGELVDYYKDLTKNYPLVSIEDPFHEEAFDKFALLRKKLRRTQIVGDDLLTTNVHRMKTALQLDSCNALLLKVNQIGTLTESLQAAKLAKDNNWNVMVSHRSGDTSDDFIADLSVGISSGQIKSGAPCRGERIAKYNQLLRIEEDGVKYAKKI